ncbi:MAG: hypothetical protein HYR76_00835 [Ignavibacteria bacterium]|nr:hypothetical protein [Ignavibacteria bacterium]
MQTSITVILFLSLLLAGCPSPQQMQREEKPASAPVKKLVTPEIIIRVGSLNLTKYSKRIETNDIATFVQKLKRDSVDILTVQGITRYPGLTTRVDIVDELAARAETHKAFGETITVSGRQNGNAAFSVYQIRSSGNTHYDGLHSTNFESALQAIVDCGVRDVVVVSTELPEKASLEDQSTVVNRLGTFNNFYINHPIIITGNLPQSDALRRMVSFDEAKLARSDDVPRIWFSTNGSLKLLGTKIEPTVFGPMIVAEFGVFRQSQP